MSVAVVTGASRGIGRAIAARLAADGLGVAVTGRDARAWSRWWPRSPQPAAVPGDVLGDQGRGAWRAGGSKFHGEAVSVADVADVVSFVVDRRGVVALNMVRVQPAIEEPTTE